MRRLRDEVKDTKKQYDKTEDDLKALQSMGQIIGEVLRQLDEDRCELVHNPCELPPTHHSAVPLCHQAAVFTRPADLGICRAVSEIRRRCWLVVRS